MNFFDNIFPFIAFVILFAVILIFSKKYRKNEQYDEMQLKIRGNAYKVSFMTTIFLLIIAGLAYSVDEWSVAKYYAPDMAFFTIFFAGIIAFAVYAIVKDAFFSVRGKMSSYIVIVLMVIAVNATVLVESIVSGEFAKDGVVTFSDGGGNALCVVCFLSILVAIIYKIIANKKELSE